MRPVAVPSGLTPPDRSSLSVLCGTDNDLWDLVRAVVARQPGSVRLSHRAHQSATSLPANLPFSAPILPVCCARAEGAHLYDVDGNDYVDCHLSYTAAVLGHNPPPVVAAVRDRIATGVGAAYFCPEQVELTELLTETVPGADRAGLFHTGADTVAAAARMARASTGRQVVAKFQGSYHGSHEIGLYNSLGPAGPRDPASGYELRPGGNGLRALTGDDLLVLPFDDQAALGLVAEHAADLACVVVDPVPRFRGQAPHAAREFLRALRAVTAEHDVPLVVDEVITGFRMAPGGAQEAFGVTADITCLGKLTSGLGVPLSAVTGRADHLDRARSDGLPGDASKTWLSSTHQANHLAVVAALAQLRHLRDHHGEIFDRIDGLHDLLRARLDEFAHRSGIPVHLRGHPRHVTLLALGEPLDDRASYEEWAEEMGSPAMVRAMQMLSLHLRLRGVYTLGAPTMNLSAAHTEADIDQITSAVADSLLVMARQNLLPT
ncbi:aminotransferase class III-fold pyridoxal phosphate-dependent enzyme [Streptoalloteichus tenebrarius]|uniref:aminotransferase class III-fold pyridoxal phosphate-dependent enzyme n=1 Tax=Streptoalloteichus tenebrarius (strain ATCC 17920 / DSM 40477 / JCM 4838 / CBS 697.72 / NBRC 16177 / NCIMB 11028 / NRRL B-12390 / A12253. 1 / ISP 5477) TaxID=1933 RepID=UPI0020A601A4|nr:aminotransferase class III-fold pyridoxal phosphate-dependent enzyme [Streptoalloteichus tenebrarius]